jgi:dihydrofolate reductase
MRELRYFVASSIDGFIADAVGSFDRFPTAGDHIDDLVRAYPETLPGPARASLGIDAENRWVDTVLMGRKTYEVGLRLGIASPYPHLRQYVFSRTLAGSPSPEVEQVASDPVAFVRALKARPGRAIWLCGGGSLAAALLTEIDELIVKLNPILLGRGIPLFADGAPPALLTRLTRTDLRAYESGVTFLHYRLSH